MVYKRVVLFFIFLHARCKLEFSVFYQEWRVQYFKGQTWLMLKAATGIIDHGVKTGIPVEQRAKALVFKSLSEEYSTSLYLYSLKQVVITVKVITKIGLNTRFVVKF